MKSIIEKGFRQLFGLDVTVLNLPDTDIAIYILDKKISKISKNVLGDMKPNFTISRVGKNFDIWSYTITLFDEDRENDMTIESVSTYKTSEQAFVGLMKEWFGSEILMKFMQRNIKKQ